MQGLLVRGNEWRRTVAKTRNFVLIIPTDMAELRGFLHDTRTAYDEFPQGKGATRRPPIYVLHWEVIRACVANLSTNRYAGHVPLQNLSTFLNSTITGHSTLVRSFKSFGRRPGRIPTGEWLWSLEWDDMSVASRTAAETCLQYEEGWTKAGLEFRKDYAPMDNAERAVYNASI
jgi:hypothetical protein